MTPYQAFIKQKAPATLRRVYGTLGDAVLQERVVASLIAAALPEDARDFNLEILDGETASVTDVLAAAGNLPFLSEARVVHVRRAERIDNIGRAAAKADSASTDDDDKKTGKGKISPAKRFAEALSTLPETTILILSRTPETPEPGARATTPRCINAAIDKVIEKEGSIIDCTVGAKAAALAIGVVQDEARRRGLEVEPRAIAHLVERVGHDISLLLQELEKCSLRVAGNQPITVAVVDEMTRRTLQETIFNLTDAIGERRGPVAITLVRDLMESGNAPEQILATLTGHLRLLFQARAFLDAGLQFNNSLSQRMPREMAQQLPNDGRHNLLNIVQTQSWRAQKIGKQAGNFQTPQLQRALEAALETDLALKGIEGDGGSPELLMELLVTRLTHA